MMIAIKAKEEEQIEKTLDIKNMDEINYVTEEIISRFNTYEMLDLWKKNNIWSGDDIQNYKSLKEITKQSNRLEKNLLLSLINLCIKSGKEIKVGNVLCRQIIFEEPLVSELISITGIIAVRRVLKNLMKKCLIAVNEEHNYMLIPEYIILKKNIISDMNEKQNDIDAQLKFLTMSRQNFTCMTCGEDGKRLKIAYLTADKKTLNLNEVVALCEDCFDLLTKNEILIDGMISFEVKKTDIPKSLRFVLTHIPEAKESQKVCNSIIDIEEKYGWDNSIRAFAISINRIQSKNLELTVENLIAYTIGILNKADLENEGVIMYSNVYEKYKLYDWNISEICIRS